MKTRDKDFEEIIQMFLIYKGMCEKSIQALSDNDLAFKPDDESNSIKIIMLHVAGNLKSRWTNFLYEDGEKPWRMRDHEFEDYEISREELLKKWNSAWACLFNTLEGLNNEDFEKVVFIRKEPHSVWKAIHRQLAHYAYHTGQIVLIAKHLQKANWNTLSIPKRT